MRRTNTARSRVNVVSSIVVSKVRIRGGSVGTVRRVIRRSLWSPTTSSEVELGDDVAALPFLCPGNRASCFMDRQMICSDVVEHSFGVKIIGNSFDHL